MMLNVALDGQIGVMLRATRVIGGALRFVRSRFVIAGTVSALCCAVMSGGALMVIGGPPVVLS